MILGVLLLLLLNGCFLLPRYGSIEGYVYVPESPTEGKSIILRDSPRAPAGYKPLVGATVGVEGSSNTTTTDIYGYFILIDISIGTIIINITPPSGSGYQPLIISVEVILDSIVGIGNDGSVSLPSENADYWDVTINRIDTSNWPEVKVYVQVIDPINDSPIIGANDFKVDINGHEIGYLTVQSAGASASSSSSSLVIDRSGSMSGTKLSDAKDAAKTFVGFMTANDRAEVVSFSYNVSVDQAFTNGKSALYNAIDSLSAGGDTSLYDGIWKGLDDTNLETSERKAVIALTDGKENYSSSEHGGGNPPNNSLVIAHAQELNIPIYTIGLGLSKGFTVEEGVRISKDFDPTEDLRQIAEDTGGKFFKAPTSTDLEYIYVQITQRIQQQYIITFTDNTGITDGILTVKVNYNQMYGEASKDYEPYGPSEVISDPRDRAAAALKAVEEFYGLFTLPENFPKSLVLAMIAQETGRTFDFDNEIVSFDWGRGLMQITTDDYVGAGSGGCESDYCWNCRGRQNEEACYSYYSNTQEGINRNVRDSYYALDDKFSNAGYCANSTGYENDTIITPEEMCWISTVQRYNTYSEHPTAYVYYIGDKLKNLSWNWYDVEAVEDNPDLGNKFIEAYNNKEEVILCSYANLLVYDSRGRAKGLIEDKFVQEIPNSIYDPNSFYDREREIVIIFFPIDSYRYEVVGREEGIYRLTINSAKEGDITSFEAIDIPISAGVVHQYTIDWNILSQGEEGVTVQMDLDGDGTPELTITTASTFTFVPAD